MLKFVALGNLFEHIPNMKRCRSFKVCKRQQFVAFWGFFLLFWVSSLSDLVFFFLGENHVFHWLDSSRNPSRSCREAAGIFFSIEQNSKVKMTLNLRLYKSSKTRVCTPTENPVNHVSIISHRRPRVDFLAGRLHRVFWLTCVSAAWVLLCC